MPGSSSGETSSQLVSAGVHGGEQKAWEDASSTDGQVHERSSGAILLSAVSRHRTCGGPGALASQPFRKGREMVGTAGFVVVRTP